MQARRISRVAILPRLDRCPVARNQSLRVPFIHGPSLFQAAPGPSRPSRPSPEPDAAGGVKVGAICTLAENPGEISRFECLGRPRGISGRLARVQATLPAKQWALLNIRRRWYAERGRERYIYIYIYKWNARGGGGRKRDVIYI